MKMKIKMAASYGSGYHSPPPISRSVDRVFEEAQYTGDIHLSGRTLRDYPKLCSKYDLSDTVVVDISRNRLLEVPHEVCEYLSIERINCYHNIIRSIPDSIQQLQSLIHLNLSRNQLSVLPPALCMLGVLEVLSVSNNKLVSLPEEIGRLKNLMDLDVSCNEISRLPLQIGDLPSLRCLNLRRNFLIALPLEISRLQLYRLDFSCNRIEKIPTVFRKIETLQHLVLDHNPLTSPPAHVCIKGKQHIMKYLQTEAVREDRKKSIMMNSDLDMKRIARKSLPPQQPTEEFKNMLVSPESKWKRHTVLNDSGYSTADGLERNGWHSTEGMLPNEENSKQSKFLRKDQNHHYLYQNCHLQQPFCYKQQNQIFGLGSSPSRVSQSQSERNLQQQSSSLPALEFSSSEPVQPGRNLSNLVSGYQQKCLHDPICSNPDSSFSHPHHSEQRTESSLSSASDHRSAVPASAFCDHRNEKQISSLNNSFSGSDLDVVVSRQRSNSSLSDYQLRHHTNSTVSEPLWSRSFGGSSGYQSHPSSLRYEGFKSAAELTRSGSLLPRPLHSVTHLSQGQHLCDDRNTYQSVPDQTVDTESESPPLTPLTPPTPPIIMTGDMEDEFTRELKRQKAEYERKKKQAELIRVQQEEEEEREKEERRRAAQKLQEEQKLLIEKQEEQKKREDLQQQEEGRRQKELAHPQEERKKEDHTRVEEVQRPQETVTNQDGIQVKQLSDTHRITESKPSDKNSTTNNYLHHTSMLPQTHNRPLPTTPSSSSSTSRLPKPPSSLPVHGIMGSPSSSSSLSSTTPSSSSSIHISPQQQQDDSKQVLTENRHELSYQSFKEQRRLAGGTQYRRATSDSLKKFCQSANPQHQLDNLNHISRNGVAESSQQSSTSTTPSVSPSPSPRNSVSHIAKPTSPSSSTSQLTKPSSPSGSASHLARPIGTKSAVPRATGGSVPSAQNQALRRTKITEDRSGASVPAATKSTKTPAASNLKQQASAISPAPTNLRRNSNSSATDDDSKSKKGPSTPIESLRPKSRLEEQSKKMMQSSGLKKAAPPDSADSNKRISTKPPTSTFGLGRGRAGGPKAQEDPSSNLTNQRREEQQREEAEQTEKLRQIIESRLRVNLPDNLAEALRDGVVLCHLANQIRPRSVGSIHVPSPAVPKLTLAKCRRNVDNFLDACKKIGVDQERICGPQDILDEKGIIRMTMTVTALVTVGSNPKQSAV